MTPKQRIARKRMQLPLYDKFLHYQELSRLETQIRKEKEAIRGDLKKAFEGRDVLLTPKGDQRVIKQVSIVEGHWVEEYERVTYCLEEIL